MEGSVGFTGLLEGDIECGGGSGVTPHVTATAQVDANTGTPTVTVTRTGTDENPNFNFSFQNLKGETGLQGIQGIQGLPGSQGIPGERGPRGFTGATGATGSQGPAGESPIVTASATIDNTVGTPSVSVTKTGSDLFPNFAFEFHNLKGVPGADSTVPGPQGPAGPAGPGIASGGTVGQFLKKAGISDYLTDWGDITAAEVGLDIEDCQIVTQTDLQGAVEELDAALVAVNSSLTQLPPNISFGSPEVITWTNDKFTCPNSGVITGYLRKSANSTAGLFGLLSNKVPNGDYRAIKNFYTTSEYQDLNLLVVKGEELTIGNKTEIGTIHLIYIPFAQNS